MAGNIIHAIATTNATIAGMIVVEAIKILTGFPKDCKVNPVHFSYIPKAVLWGLVNVGIGALMHRQHLPLTVVLPMYLFPRLGSF